MTNKSLADIIRENGVVGIASTNQGYVVQYNYGGRIENTNPNNADAQKGLFIDLFGEQFAEDLYSGSFNSLMQNGILSGSLTDEGFNISLDLSNPEIGSSAPAVNSSGTGLPPSSTEATTTQGSSTTGTSTSTTASGNTGTSSGGSSGVFGGGVSSGTGSIVDQQLLVQTQLSGQQAYNAQQQKNNMLDSLVSSLPQNVDLGSLVAGILSNGLDINDTSGLSQNMQRQQMLRRQSRGTASTKVKDKIQTQAVLSQPTLLGNL